MHDKFINIAHRKDIDQISRDYLNLSAEQARDADVPLLFISFPSAKDPSHKERYPGSYLS